jgi:hypothetical protein
MKCLCSIFLLFLAAAIAANAQDQTGKVIIVNAGAKELRRTAHKMRIPVEQLKNARSALQDAIDLVKKMDPYPTDQLMNLSQNLVQLNRPKAKSILQGFVQNLRLKAEAASDAQTYQTATSSAMLIMQVNSIFEQGELLDMIQTWPEPKESFGPMAKNLIKNAQSSAIRQEMQNLASTDPEKALELLPQSSALGVSDGYQMGQIARGLMNAGKKDQAMKLVDQTISSFNPNSTDASSFNNYYNFVQNMSSNLDSTRAATAINQLLQAMPKQPAQQYCSTMSLAYEGATVDLNCSETRILSLLRTMQSRPGVVAKAIDSAPELKSKLESIGGFDNVSLAKQTYGNQTGLANQINNQINNTTIIMNGQVMNLVSSGSSTVSYEDISSLVNRLKGKAETNRGYVRAEITKAIKGQDPITFLVAFASRASNDDSELASVALELAQQQLNQIEPLQKRMSAMQNLINAYRQVEGEVDPEILRNGFVLADQLREEQEENKKKMPIAQPQINSFLGSAMTSQADQFEAFLISELARDSFDKAMAYIRSMTSDSLKLYSYVRVAQALRQTY